MNIVFIINSGLKAEIVECIKKASAYYGVKSICLGETEKVDGHPTAKGMTEICDQIIESL